MDIHYTHNGTDITLSVPVTANAVHEEELMKSDHIRLSFDGAEGIEFPLDAYIIPFSDGVRYSLLEPYSPEQKSEEHWHYEPLFQHPKMYLGKVPFVFPTKDSDNKDITQLEWEYTGFVGTLLEYFCEQINNALGLTGNDKFTYSIVGKIEDIVSTTFSSVDILSGLSDIANKLKCEYHLDWSMKTLYFGHIILNTQGVEKPMLEVGVNVGSPSVRSSKEGYWNAFEPQGSTRNISKKAATGENVQSTVRLSLREYTEGGTEKYPDGIVYTDGKGHVITKSEFEQSGMSLHLKSLIFDNVYPKLDLYVYDVRSRERYLLDENNHKVIDHYEDGEPVYKRYSIWYMRLAYPTYNQQGEVTAWTDYTIDPQTQIIDGKELYGAFQPNTKTNAESSPLAGRGNGDDGNYGFALNYHTQGEVIPANVEDGDSGVVIKAGDYEIVFQQSGDLILPTTEDGGIVPKGEETPSLLGNIVNLYNIVMDSSFTQSAQNELENETKKEIANIVRDNNTYTLKSYPDAFEGKDENLQDRNPHLYIGQGVTYKNDGYTLETRVMKLVTNIDYDFVQEITIGNEVIKGATTTLKEQVQSILAGGAGNGGGVDENAVRRIIKAFSDARYLSKVNDDVAQGFLTLIKGLQIGANFVPDILGEGGVLRMREDGKVELVTDILYARVKAYFDSVEVRKYQHTGGNRIASVAGNKICRVAWFNSSNEELEQTQANLASVAYFRCYFRASDGEDTVRNNWVVGDQAYCHITSVATATDNPEQKGLNQKHLWRLVVGRNTEGTLTEDGEAYIDLSNRATETVSGTSYTGYQSGSDIPAAQDDIIQLGNVNDTTRQGAIVEFVTGTNAPSYQIYQGINSFSLNGKNQITIGYNTATGKAEMKVYGDAYIGDRNRSTFIEYKQDDGTQQHAPILNIKAKIQTLPNSTYEGKTAEQFVQDNQLKYDTDIQNLTNITNDLQSQIDGEIISWFYEGTPTLSNAPAVDWDTDTLKERHLGDMYYDVGTGETSGFAYRFVKTTSGGVDTYSWQYINDTAITLALAKAAEALGLAGTKAKTFTTANNVLPSAPYNVGDLWLNATGTWGSGANAVTWENEILKCINACPADGTPNISDWAKASKYTDDSAFNGYINALLNGSGASGDSATAAAIQKAIASALGSGIVVDGGLLLTSLIGMRKYKGSGSKTDVANYDTWAGISGQYDANVLGGGIAAWYGGGMLDKETLTTTQISQGWSTLRWSKGLDRFDGSGYRADGNNSWDANGALTIKNITTLSDSNNKNILNELATFNSAFTFGTDGQGSTTALYITPQVPFERLYIGTSNANKQEVATMNWVSQNFVTTTFFDNLFRLYNGTTKINVNGTLPSDTSNLNIEAMFGFWTKKYISALGQGDDGTTSYTTLAQLNDVTLTNPTANQVLSYNGTHWVNRSIELGSQTLADLTDVVITSPAANQMLGYDATTQKWKNIAIPATGVTSVALSMPTGFSITGSPITASGTFTVTFASGYSLPTTAKQTNWDTAYGWGDHSTAGYALAADLGTAASHAHSDYLTSLSWDSTNKKLAWAKGGTAQTAITIGYASVAGSVAWDNVSSKPTTLSGYGITDAKIANGVITLGANSITPVTTLNTLSIYGGTTKVVSFKPNADASLYIKAGGDISLTNDTTNKYITLSYSHPTDGADTTINAANGKVLSAITVNSLGHVTSVSSKTLAAADIPSLNANKITAGTLDAARLPDLSETYATVDRATTLEGYFTNGVAKKAAQLNTSHTLWGQSFDGTANVSGNMTNVGNITMAATNGTYIQLGDIRIVYDSANNALKVVKSDGTTAANFYATGGISALGQNVDGQAGTGDVTWDLLADNTDTRQIAMSHITNVLGTLTGYTTSGKNYAVKKDTNNNLYVYVPWEAGSGTVTAIKVGTTTYNPSSGVVSLPAYPTLAGLMGSSAIGSTTQPVYWTGSAWATTTYTLGKSVPSNAVFTDTWTAWAGATSTAAGTAGYMPAPTSAQRTQFLRGDGTWVSLNNYTLPTASADTLGGVKIGTTLAIASGVLNLPTTGVTAGTYKRVTVDAYGRVTSGDNTDIDTNTWRNIYVDGTSEVGTGIDTKAINFKAGSNVAISYVAAGTGSGKSGNANYFDIVISATDTTYSNATQSVAGLMSATDKAKLDGVAANANNYSLPLAASGTRGGVKIGYSETNSGSDTTRNYAVQLSSEKMYVNVPWVNTWRGIQNNLTSTSTTDSLSAAQGKALKGYIDTLNGYFSGGVANSAAKLTTVSKTAWGQTFWTSGGVPSSISGALSSVTNITMSGYIKIGDAYLSYDSTNNAIRVSANADGTGAMNFYARGGVSALGETADGQAGVGDVTWALLADGTDTRQIALSHLTTALGSYATQSWVDGHFGYTTSGKNYAVKLDANGNAYVNVPWEAGSGTVTSVKVGTTTYTPTAGVISLPAYPTVPTKVSQLTNDSGYITGYTDTKNTAGTTNKAATKLYIVGAESQAANPQTYSNVNVYIGTDNCLYSNNTKVLTSHQSVTNKGATLSWGSAVTVATIGSTDIKVSLPSNPNTNTTYKFTIGSTTKGDATNGVDLGTLKSETAASGGTTLSLVTTGEKYSWNNKTYTTSIATDSGTNQLTLAFGTKYKLTAGGQKKLYVQNVMNHADSK